MFIRERENIKMKKTPSNHNKSWTATQEKQLDQLARGNTPTPLIAYKMQRTEPAIRAKAHELEISLKPTNKPPYNRRKK
jgi:hypothetical protein